MEGRDEYISTLEEHIDELIQLICNSLGNNPYDDLNKIKSIVAQRNYSQFGSIEKKLKDLGISLYNRRLSESSLISNKINELIAILKKLG
jgi:Zn-dependent M16 (insulinase) family peptidase